MVEAIVEDQDAVAQAIGRTIGVAVPARIDALVAEGALGRKSGRGFHAYEP